MHPAPPSAETCGREDLDVPVVHKQDLEPGGLVLWRNVRKELEVDLRQERLKAFKERWSLSELRSALRMAFKGFPQM
jgi:hypothetical protein